MSEMSVKASIRLALGRHAPHVRLFNNPVGLAWQGKQIGRDGSTLLLEHPRRVTYGLQPGSGDLIGWTTVEITPDMVGQRIAVFTSAEVKAAAAVQVEQKNWRAVVTAAGGFADVVRTEDDALRLVRAK